MKALAALFAAALLLTAIAARADESDIQTGEMLSALIAGSAKVQLVNEEGHMENLADVLGNALAVDIMAARQNKQESTVLNSVSGRCDATDVGKFGVVYYDCSLTILDGDYKLTPNGFEGPELESSITLTFRGTKKLEGGKFRLEGKKIRVMRAG